jgi:hypothetical protein
VERERSRLVLPLAYRYQPEALVQPPHLSADTLYVVSGLYGNLAALQRPGYSTICRPDPDAGPIRPVPAYATQREC